MNLLLLAGIGIAFLLMIGAGVALLIGGQGGSVDQRLDQFVERGQISAVRPESAAARPDMADRLDKAMSGRGFFGPIKQQISRADVKLRVSEYIIFVFAFAGLAAFLAYRLFDGPVPVKAVFALLGALVGARIPRTYLRVAATRRIRAFDEQLSDTLNLWVNSLRSGYSVLQGMEAIATELPAPVSKEFERVVQEVRLGLSLNHALDNMLRRVPSEDLDLVVTAVNIQREVGGNLAEILDIISFTIRERVRIKGEIRTLTAQGRASGWIISFLPIVLGLILYLINPDYVSELFVKEKPFAWPNVIPCGWVLVGISLIMIASGAFAIQRIVDIEV